MKSATALQEMYVMQDSLLKKFIILEDLPEIPLDVNTKKGQKHLREFCRRIIEELSESYECLGYAFEAVTANRLDVAQKWIVEYNEEIGDQWHFVLELLMYSGIFPADIEQYIEQFLQEHPEYGGLMNPKDVMGSLIGYAEIANHLDNIAYQKSVAGAFVIFPEDAPLQNGGCRRLSHEILRVQAILLWECTYLANKAMNCLKSRDWKIEEITVNKIMYHQRLMDFLFMYMRYMVFSGKNIQGIYTSYQLKNEINHERVKGRL